MTRKARRALLSMVFAALIAGCGESSGTSVEANHGMARADFKSARNSQADNPVHSITLPHDEPMLPPGPGREAFVAACVVCHSPRYITMQPRFSRSTWLGEVKKMKDVYGGHISDEQVPKIADYLVFINGKSDDPTVPKSATYGE